MNSKWIKRGAVFGIGAALLLGSGLSAMAGTNGYETYKAAIKHTHAASSLTNQGSLVVTDEQAMAQVGCVIEAADAYDYMTGRQNLRQAARCYLELPLSRIDEVLEMTSLTLKRVLMNIANNGGQSAWRGDNNTCTCGALRFACT